MIPAHPEDIYALRHQQSLGNEYLQVQFFSRFFQFLQTFSDDPMELFLPMDRGLDILQRYPDELQQSQLFQLDDRFVIIQPLLSSGFLPDRRGQDPFFVVVPQRVLCNTGQLAYFFHRHQ